MLSLLLLHLRLVELQKFIFYGRSIVSCYLWLSTCRATVSALVTCISGRAPSITVLALGYALDWAIRKIHWWTDDSWLVLILARLKIVTAGHSK